MSSRALCPVLIGRDEPLSLLEDALLAASRGDSRVIALAGEAGVGKTRMTAELATRAHKLGFDVMWGGCSEAELQLPYLPFVEAVGNWLAERDLAAVAERLGPVRAELAQIFPQLSDGEARRDGGDAGQAKLRFLEAAVTLLSLPARERGLLLVVEDIHWADASTRELLDHLARRLSGIRALVLATFRSDEIERRHPLRPVIQAWRRSGTAELITIDPLTPDGVASMIGTILDTGRVSEEFRDLIYERSEGNPFVVEEMLKDAIDRGDVYYGDDGWERKPIDQIGIPETVRDTILLRVERLDQRHVPVLQAAAVLGRSFDYASLVVLAGSDEAAVEAAVEAAMAQQLIEEDPGSPGRFRWRHALTQEAIYTDIMLPRRHALHGRAADELARTGAPAAALAHHLLEAGRFAEAVPACLRAADDAMRTFAFRDSVAMLESVVAHASDTDRATITGRLGKAHLFAGQSKRAAALLAEAIRLFEQNGRTRDAAVHRILLSRALWELLDSDGAERELAAALSVLEPMGPSPELALIYLRMAGLTAFRLEYATALKHARTAAEVARLAGAEFERLWAEGFVALGLIGTGSVDEGLALCRRVATEAAERGYPIAVQNTCWNEIWLRVHMMVGGFDEPLGQIMALPDSGFTRSSTYSSRAAIRLRTGDLSGALDDAEKASAVGAEIEMKKVQWRGALQRAECLLALGRIEEAGRVLPPTDSVIDLQDHVYQAPAQIGYRLATGDVEGAAEIAETIAAHAEQLAPYRETLALAAEAFIAAGRPDDARDVLRSRGFPHPCGLPATDYASGLLHLAEADAAAALASFQRAFDGAAERGFLVHATRARLGIARALRALGRAGEAAGAANEAARGARRMQGAHLVREALQIAREAGGVPGDDEPDPAPAAAAAVELGERMVTSLFADIRGYTHMTSSSPPAAMSDRLATLYRWAKTEVERQRGIVDKFAGDAVMATFNVSGATVDHTVHALQAAMALRDKACLTDVGIGLGIAVGPAVVSSTAAGADNLMVMGESTNLAARLQAAAGPGEILLSGEAFRRVADWLAERGIITVAEDLTLKGFDEPVRAYRIRGAAQASAR